MPTRWPSRSMSPPTSNSACKSLANESVSLTIVDPAGGGSAATTAAIRHADLCLIPARPSVADNEATAPTLSAIRAWNKPFAFVLNQTAIRGQRITNAASALGEQAALDLADVLAQPFIVMRNDHQDALSAGLAVSEFAPGSKSADEIRGLWQWIEARLTIAIAVDEHDVNEVAASPALLPAMVALTPAEQATLAP